MVLAGIIGFIAGTVIGIMLMGVMASKRIDEVKVELNREWQRIVLDITDNKNGDMKAVSIQEWLNKYNNEYTEG